jgi:hypothetical protein
VIRGFPEELKETVEAAALLCGHDEFLDGVRVLSLMWTVLVRQAA